MSSSDLWSQAKSISNVISQKEDIVPWSYQTSAVANNEGKMWVPLSELENRRDLRRDDDEEEIEYYTYPDGTRSGKPKISIIYLANM